MAMGTKTRSVVPSTHSIGKTNRNRPKEQKLHFVKSSTFSDTDTKFQSARARGQLSDPRGNKATAIFWDRVLPLCLPVSFFSFAMAERFFQLIKSTLLSQVCVRSSILPLLFSASFARFCFLFFLFFGFCGGSKETMRSSPLRISVLREGLRS